ncbi:alpha/beta-hydrolase [Mycena galericulata]|nr:alpha/beta-hydrolase [Mycena galericulata]
MAAIPALRPRKSWPFRRALILHVMKALVNLFFDIGFPVSVGQDPEAIAASPNASETGFTWVDPLADAQIVGELKELAVLNNARLKEPRRTRKVIMHLHSGGHVMGSAHPRGGPAGPFCNGLLQHCSQITRIFSCGYRLAASAPFPAANPFPAGLLDSLAGYNYLVHINRLPAAAHIRGNLAIALIRYLASNAFSVLSLPVPRGLILVSPSVEWGITHDGPTSSWRLNRSSDYSTPFFLSGYTQRSLLGNLPPEFAFTKSGFPQTFIVAGEAEIARDSIRTFRDRLCWNIGEGKVTYSEMKDVTHDVVTMRWFEPERTGAIIDISTWIEKVLN